jgi:MFS transporter, FSR family, fosmidomycin resistance protein
MTTAAERLPPLPRTRAGENRLVAGVCLAHLVSHYYMLLLPALFVFIRADYGVSYTELSLALTAFSLVSATVQTPVGFLVDRIGARSNLIGGLLLGSGAIAVAALVDSYWVFVAMYALLGLSNTVYHPSDYSLLSENVAPQRMTQVFSYHTCSGMIGGAIAPVVLLFLRDLVGWRGAFLASAALGLAAAVNLLAQGEPPAGLRTRGPRTKTVDKSADAGWQMLLSPPILMNFLFFVMLSMVNGGLNQYLVAGLGALYGTPPATASTALTGLLTMSAVGVLIGGVYAGRTSHHNLVAASGLMVTGAVALLIGLVNPGTVLLIAVVSLGGFATGVCLPSRDMIVRAATPEGSFGKVFGFVTTGLHVGGIIAPLIFAQFLDRGVPQWVFFYVAICAVVSVLTVGFGMSSRRVA